MQKYITRLLLQKHCNLNILLFSSWLLLRSEANCNSIYLVHRHCIELNFFHLLHSWNKGTPPKFRDPWSNPRYNRSRALTVRALTRVQCITLNRIKTDATTLFLQNLYVLWLLARLMPHFLSWILSLNLRFCFTMYLRTGMSLSGGVKFIVDSKR